MLPREDVAACAQAPVAVVAASHANSGAAPVAPAAVAPVSTTGAPSGTAAAAAAASAEPGPAITDVQSWAAVTRGAPTLPRHQLELYLPVLGIPTLLSCHQALQDVCIYEHEDEALDRLVDLIEPCLPHAERDQHRTTLSDCLRPVLAFAR